ncbi:MAG: motility associated factor glycosyltransferase family protein [Treponema sp.]|nr:motility associated factor glycosyltransferase family protein [Candidatus Treponema scatequi]
MQNIWLTTFSNNASLLQTRFPDLYALLEPQIKSVVELLNKASAPDSSSLQNPQTSADDNPLQNPASPESLSILNSIFSFWTFTPSKSGELTVKENNIFLHSSYSPKKEAEKLFSQPSQAADTSKPVLNSQPADTSKAVLNSQPAGFDTDTTFLFAGFGLGYAPIECAKKHDGLIILAEPDPGYLFASMCALDWTPLFNHKSVVIITQAPAEQTATLVEAITPLDKIKVITSNSQTAHQTSWFKTFFTLIERNRQKQNINTNTLERFSSLWLKNSAKNLKTISESSGINIYKNMITSDIPCVICAAGPTLENILPHLKEIKKRAFIIAVDTALKALLKNGIEPDFIVLVDPQYYAAKHIEGLSSASSVLITESSVYPSVMRFNCRKKVFIESLFPLGKYFEENLLSEKTFGKISAGGSVTTSAYDAAKYFGAKKIYISGLDLGFPQKKTHIRGSTFEERSHLFSTKIKPAENNLASLLFNDTNEKAKDYEQNEIITDSKMKLFAWWFESEIAKNKSDLGIDTYTLSTKSLMIPGMQTARIEDLLSLKDVEKNKWNLLEQAERSDKGFSKEQFDKVYDNLSNLFDQLLSKAKKGLSITEKILSLPEALAEQKSREQFPTLSEIDSYILNSDVKKVASLVFPTQRQLDSILAKEPPLKSDILKNIQRSKIIYRELITSIKKYQKYI